MLGLEILEVAIGLGFIYLLLSLMASAIREGVESVLKTRAVHLERGIRALLDDTEGEGLARHFYEHPLISALYMGRFRPDAKRRVGGSLPTYIPARSFAVALMDLVVQGPAIGPSGQRTASITVEDLRNSIQRIPSPFVQRALAVAIDGAESDRARVQANLETWFNSAMDQVSGWYKRRTQYFLLATGLVATLALNVNSITIGNYLWHDRDAREALVASAERALQDSVLRSSVTADTSRAATIAARARYAEIVKLDLPLGWNAFELPDAELVSVESFTFWTTQVFGLLLTALAVMMGAPFWFDVLNKIVALRSTVKPKEDVDAPGTQPGVRVDLVSAGAAAATVNSPAPALAGGTTSVAIGTRGTVTMPPATQSMSTPNAWSSGNPDEGIL